MEKAGGESSWPCRSCASSCHAPSVAVWGHTKLESWLLCNLLRMLGGRSSAPESLFAALYIKTGLDLFFFKLPSVLATRHAPGFECRLENAGGQVAGVGFHITAWKRLYIYIYIYTFLVSLFFPGSNAVFLSALENRTVGRAITCGMSMMSGTGGGWAKGCMWWVHVWLAARGKGSKQAEGLFACRHSSVLFHVDTPHLNTP